MHASAHTIRPKVHKPADEGSCKLRQIIHHILGSRHQAHPRAVKDATPPTVSNFSFQPHDIDSYLLKDMYVAEQDM